jgi:allantoinase
MAELDLKIAGGKLATATGVFDVDIGIRDGRIAAIGAWGNLPPASEVLDAKGRVVLPGGIDTHCHAGDPGFEDFGIDFGLASRAGALGGVTTIIDMPVQIPLTEDPESFDKKLASIQPKACVDFALWATSTSETIQHIPALKDKGVVGFKFYMHASVGGFTPYHDDGVIFEALREVAKTGLPAGMHCENQLVITHLEKKLGSQGRNDILAFAEAHPVFAEAEAVNRALFMARELGARLHVVHCSTAQGVALVQAAKKAGQAVTVETCPQYLVLDASIFGKMGNFAKVAPPIRDRQNVEEMWQLLAQGQIDNVSSDHVPFPPDFKEGKTIWEAAAGAPVIQTMFPVLLAEGVNRGRITLPRLVRVMSEGPARAFGLYPKKGCATIGADADFALFRLGNETTIRAKDLVGTVWTLFEGMSAVYPETTIVRGKVIAEQGEIIGQPGYGQMVAPLNSQH